MPLLSRLRWLVLLPVLALSSGPASAESMREWFFHREGGRLHALTDASVPPLTPDWNDPVDFAALRRAYAMRADFKQRCGSRPNADYFAATKRGDFERAATLLEKWLGTCPVDAQAHIWLAGTYAKLSKPDLAKVHGRWFFGLTDVVLNGGGNGKTPQTAFEAISIPEEKAVMLRLGYPYFTGQNLTTVAPYVDEVTGKTQTDQTGTFYFDFRWQFIREQYELGLPTSIGEPERSGHE